MVGGRERNERRTDAALSAAIRAYASSFDGGRYWEAHERLEEHWQQDRQAVSQGLIQLAAAFVHIEAGRFGGAARVLLRGLTRLDAAPANHGGLDIAALRSRIRPLLAHLDRLSSGIEPRFDDGFRLRMADYLRERLARE